MGRDRSMDNTPPWEPSQGDVERIITELEDLRVRTMSLMAHPYIDAGSIEWIVNHGNRVGGEHFVQITPQELKNLPHSQVKIYAHVKRIQGVDSGWCKDSTARIAQDTGLGMRTVKRELPKMIEDNKLHKHEVKAVFGGEEWEQRPHWYRVNDTSHWSSKLLLKMANKGGVPKWHCKYTKGSLLETDFQNQ